jgi:phenylacetate-CoA ligase
MDLLAYFEEIKNSVPAYRKFLEEKGIKAVQKPEDIPLTDKQNYLMRYPMTELIREGSMDKCFLIGASSGFSKGGSVLWLKESVDEADYLEKMRQLLMHDYDIENRPTLIIVSLALGMWIAGMQIACVLRSLAGNTDGVVTATPGIDLLESVHIAKEFGPMFDRIVWITNPSSINIIYSLLRDEKELLQGKIYFPVVGEYFTEGFRENIARKFGHDIENPYVVKTGYGSADTGDLGIESRETIGLRKFLHHHPQRTKELFHTEDAPMFFIKNDHALMEIVDGNLVVSKEQFIPLLRYNTGDAGAIISKEVFRDSGLDKQLYDALPDELLYVFGRASEALVFYGTNLNIYAAGDFLNSLDDSFNYGGLYEMEKKERRGVEELEITVYVLKEEEGLAARYQKKLLDYLKNNSREFNAKYDQLMSSAGYELVRVNTKLMSDKNKAEKHHTIKK